MTAYHGGKARGGRELAEVITEFASSIEDATGKDFMTYWEPFCGMCGVYRHIPELLGKRKYLASDIHPSLIKMWKKLKQGWVPPKHVSMTEYNDLKDQEKSSAEKAYVGFGYSFGGKYFGGFIGSNPRSFKSPKPRKNSRRTSRNGKKCNSRPRSRRNCLLHETSMGIARKLKLVSFACRSYDEHIQGLNGWIIYCDPPYADCSNSGFNSDDEGDENDEPESFDSKAFWKWARRTSVNNLVIVSEYTAPKDFVSIYNRNIKATNKVGYDKSRSEHLYVHEKWIEIADNE